MECHKSYKLCLKRTLANKTLQLLEALVEIKGSLALSSLMGLHIVATSVCGGGNLKF